MTVLYVPWGIIQSTERNLENNLERHREVGRFLDTFIDISSPEGGVDIHYVV